jgi:hypothetical protein
MKAECTWGDGPDVLLILDGTDVMLYHDPVDLDRSTHGTVREGSACLTVDEARALAHQLLEASRQAEQLDKEFAHHMKVYGDKDG